MPSPGKALRNRGVIIESTISARTIGTGKNRASCTAASTRVLRSATRNCSSLNRSMKFHIPTHSASGMVMKG